MLIRYAAIKEINLNTEVQKPSIADVLEFKGAKMECAVESTPHEKTRIYSSILEGGYLMQKFEDTDPQEPLADEERRDQVYPIRSSGSYATPTNPWPRDEQKEARDITGVQAKAVYSSKTRKSMGSIW